MIRVLFIARYRHPTMHRKVELLAAQAELSLCYIYPRLWRDELGMVEQAAPADWSFQHDAVAMFQAADPHRGMYRTLSFQMRRFRPDIIHAEEEPDSLAALQIAYARRAFAPGARLILHTWQNVDRAMPPSARGVMRATLRAADAVLCANQMAVALLQRRGFRKPAESLPAIGVDTRIFAPGAAGPERGAFTAGYIGRLVAEKDVETLIDAVARIDRPIQLVILGGGPHEAALRARAASLGNRVQFIAPMPPAQVAQHMQRLDALVLPSHTTPAWQEQFGRVLIEAMACKVPVVGSNCGAIPEVIGDAGLVFPESDIDALAGCLRLLIESPERRADLAERGYAHALRLYTQERIADRTVEFYRWLMAQT